VTGRGYVQGFRGDSPFLAPAEAEEVAKDPVKRCDRTGRESGVEQLCLETAELVGRDVGD
jgi:hypothetical protein